MKRRSSGILLHITSLPSAYGIGDIGPDAYAFADFLSDSEQNYWQLLPVSPPGPRSHNSPYTALSAFAGNTLLISPELLFRDGLLKRDELNNKVDFDADNVDYSAVIEYKNRLFDIAFARFGDSECENTAFEVFCQEHSYWLDDFAMFIALYEHYGQDRIWSDWPKFVRDRDNGRLKKLSVKLKERIGREKFLQYIFYKQWFELKKYCGQKGIKLIGDIPIYVSYESADVWAWPKLFKLTAGRKMKSVSGVPPDLFSETGQLWGNPLYDWDVHKADEYDWWMKRLKHNLRLYDIIRIDHFRGFLGYWEVSGKAKTAINGKWMPGPADDFFRGLFRHFPWPPIIVEDLGYITADVKEFIKRYEFACMKVLMFSFEGDPARNPYCVHNHIANSVVYTGTHDNNTARGWFENEANGEQKRRFFEYIGRQINSDEAAWEMARMAMMSVSNMAILPMQDVLGLGGDCRMNHPAVSTGNWRWRLQEQHINSSIAEKLAQLTRTYGRS